MTRFDGPVVRIDTAAPVAELVEELLARVDSV